MKRLIMLLVVLFPVSCLVAGCGAGDGKSGPGKGQESKEVSDYAKQWSSGQVKPPEVSTPGAAQAVQPAGTAAPAAATPATEKKE